MEIWLISKALPNSLGRLDTNFSNIGIVVFKIAKKMTFWKLRLRL